MNHAHRLAILLLTLLPSLPAAAAFQAFLDRDQVQPGESVQLTLQRDGRGNTQPDLSPLKQDFAILDAGSGSSVQIINGHLSAQVQLRLTLSPKHAGRLQIPSLTWDGEHSPALVLTVAANAGNNGNSGNATGTGGQAAADHIFLTSTLEQKQPYVQAAATLKLRIHTDQPLYQASLDFPTGSDVQIQQIGKDQHSSETRDGRTYQVIERDYLLFPQRSGRISIPGPVLAAQVADTRATASAGDPFFDRAFGNIFGRNPFSGMMNATRPFRLQGDAIVMNVRPRPASVAGQDWLPARQVSLEESWHPDGGAIHAGEPLTRHLHLSVLGQSAAQLPDLAARMPLPDGIKAYPDQPKLTNQEQDGSVDGVRDQDVALIASRPGHFQLPAMRLSWWDTTRNSLREAVLPARTLEVLPGASGGGVPPAAGPMPNAAAAAPTGPVAVTAAKDFAPPRPWPWISLAAGLGLLWLGTLIAWWRARQQAPTVPASTITATPGTDPVRAGAARKAFRQACSDNDAAAARRHLLDWAHAVWAHDPPTGLNALAQRLRDARQSALVRELDRACYAGGDWRGAPLAEALAVLPGATGKADNRTSELAGLYP
jgi:hypothetical protein